MIKLINSTKHGFIGEPINKFYEEKLMYLVSFEIHSQHIVFLNLQDINIEIERIIKAYKENKVGKSVLMRCHNLVACYMNEYNDILDDAEEYPIKRALYNLNFIKTELPK